MNVFYVYVYLDENHTPIYVGKGKDKRAWTHLKAKYKHPLIQKLQKMIREGHDPQPAFLCIEVDEEFAHFAEEEAIAHYGRKDLGTGTLLNLRDGGEGRSGYTHTTEAKLRMSEIARARDPKDMVSFKGRHHSDETKERLRAAGRLQVRSEETRKKMSESAKLRGPLSVEIKKKISNTLKLRGPMSEETRQNMSAGQKGKKHSKETKQKMSASAKLRGIKKIKNG